MTRSLNKYNGMRSASTQKEEIIMMIIIIIIIIIIDIVMILNDYYNTYIVNKGNRTEWSQETT